MEFINLMFTLSAFFYWLNISLCFSHSYITCIYELYNSTWRNSQIGENVISQLEEKSSHVAKEKQDVIGKQTKIEFLYLYTPAHVSCK